MLLGGSYCCCHCSLLLLPLQAAAATATVATEKLWLKNNYKPHVMHHEISGSHVVLAVIVMTESCAYIFLLLPRAKGKAFTNRKTVKTMNTVKTEVYYCDNVFTYQAPRTNGNIGIDISKTFHNQYENDMYRVIKFDGSSAS